MRSKYTFPFCNSMDSFPVGSAGREKSYCCFGKAQTYFRCDMDEKHPTYIVDAFTSERFGGNQAAVCLIPRVGLYLNLNFSEEYRNQ